MHDLPACGSRDVLKVLAKAGYVHVRTKGDHFIMKKPGAFRPIPVQHPVKTYPKFMLRTLIREAGLTKEEFIALL